MAKSINRSFITDRFRKQSTNDEKLQTCQWNAVVRTKILSHSPFFCSMGIYTTKYPLGLHVYSPKHQFTWAWSDENNFWTNWITLFDICQINFLLGARFSVFLLDFFLLRTLYEKRTAKLDGLQTRTYGDVERNAFGRCKLDADWSTAYAAITTQATNIFFFRQFRHIWHTEIFHKFDENILVNRCYTFQWWYTINYNFSRWYQ